MHEPVNLKARQQDYAVFLPAISTFYSTFIGRQRFGNYVDPNRVPSTFPHGVESLNFQDPQKSIFYYPWALYSAGHANLDMTKQVEKEDMIRNRDRNTSFLLGDSGGFQIAKGLWPGRWADPNDAAAAKQRATVLTWLEANMDYSMILDIPTWTFRDKKAAEACGIHSYEDAVNATKINNEYFMNNRQGKTKFLNVLQGGNHKEADDWYGLMKDYCDPKKYTNHFNGWAMGGQNMCDVHLVLKRLVALRFDGLLEKGLHDWMHFLGTSKLEWAIMLTDVQRAIRKYHNENFTISFDCASPFLANANGLIYTYNRILDRDKWTYKMEPSVDDKKYATDTRKFGDVLRDDKIVNEFLDGPISDLLKINDVCIYKPGDLNKIGKEGRTSWDSFSYALQMGHNVWAHINAVQLGNEEYDKGVIPDMLVEERFHQKFFRDVVEQVFSTSDRAVADAAVEEHNRFYMSIIGTRGFTGQRALNAHTYHSVMFGEPETTSEHTVEIEGVELDQDKLDVLEETDV
jgi:hypothetical protein